MKNIKIIALVHPGLESLAVQEIKELTKTRSRQYPLAVESIIPTTEVALQLLYHAQSFRRLLILIGTWEDPSTITFSENSFPWGEFFSSNISFKVEVERVQGQENRFALAKQVVGSLFTVLNQKGINPRIDLKKPDIKVIVFYNGPTYIVGVDLAGKELNSRFYRVFPHAASPKGDLAYFLVRKSGFLPREKLLIGFMKDGTLAIEAAIFANSISVQNPKGSLFSWHSIPCFKDTKLPSFISPTSSSGFIHAFDPSRQNYLAALKNAALAGVKSLVQFLRYGLDDLDLHYTAGELDRVIIYLTTKDEDHINELYRQARYVLKSTGTLTILARSILDLPLPSEFNCLETQQIQRGGSSYRYWVLQKK